VYVGRVIGNVVATRKEDCLVGTKLLVVRRQYIDGTLRGRINVAVDLVGAGVGETVLVVSGSAAGGSDEKFSGRIDAAIVGIVDSIEIIGE